MSKQRDSKEAISQAAVLLGKRSYDARLKRHGARKLKALMSAAGKAAAEKGVSGRPRLPDDKVKPNTLYQRARRQRLKAEKEAKFKAQKGAKTA
jgi:hypothetical protein